MCDQACEGISPSQERIEDLSRRRYPPFGRCLQGRSPRLAAGRPFLSRLHYSGIFPSKPARLPLAPPSARVWSEFRLPAARKICVGLIFAQVSKEAPRSVGGCLAQLLPRPHCDRSRAITPAPPVCIASCSSPCREPVSLTLSSSGFPLDLIPSPLSFKSGQPQRDPILAFPAQLLSRRRV